MGRNGLRGRPRGWIVRSWMIAVAAMAWASPVAAQTAPVVSASVVVTSTVVPVEMALLSKMVTVLTRETLELIGAASVTDALRLVPGVDARARVLVAVAAAGVAIHFQVALHHFGRAEGLHAVDYAP